jgi:CheY-like chemotaxis protein
VTSRVLVVDDDPAIRSLLVEALTFAGYETAAAPDGEAGVALARSGKPNVVLMDLMMPKLDGAGAIRALRADPRTAALRVIAMSAGTRLRELASHLAADSLLAKPFELDTLFEEVQRQMLIADAHAS